MTLINKEDLIAKYDRVHQGPPGGARKLMVEAKPVEAIPIKDLQRVAQVLRNSREYELRVIGNALPGIVSAWKEKQEAEHG